jgi:TPP-dependent pyruvate/acetoin dehydrogenase alpha subunit
LKIAAEWLGAEQGIQAVLLDDIDAKVRQEIAAGVEFALGAPYPDLSEVTEDVYA